MQKISHFNLSAGALKGKHYIDKNRRIFKVLNVWSGGKNGIPLRVDLLNINTEEIQKIKIEDFKKYLINQQLIQI